MNSRHRVQMKPGREGVCRGAGFIEVIGDQREPCAGRTGRSSAPVSVSSAMRSLRNSLSGIVVPVEARRWTFLSNHGHVLVCLAVDPDSRLRDIAERVGITERATQQIVRDLEQAGYVVKERMGRRNRYVVVRSRRLRHPLEHQVRIGELTDLIITHAASPD